MVQERDRIRVLLLENSLSQVWLINRLEEKGILTDKSELSSALSGSRRGEKIDKIISASTEILNDYLVRLVHTSGALSHHVANDAYGVVPACIFIENQ